MGNSSSTTALAVAAAAKDAAATRKPKTSIGSGGGGNDAQSLALRRRSTRNGRLPSAKQSLQPPSPPPLIVGASTLATNGGGDNLVHRSASNYELRRQNAPSSLTIRLSADTPTAYGAHPAASGCQTPDASQIDATNVLISSRFAQPATSTSPATAAAAASASLMRQKSIRRADPSHPIFAPAREICRACLETPHLDLGNRVFSRVYEKRPDFQKFVIRLGKERWPLLTTNLQNFLDAIVSSIESVDTLCALSRRYGEEFLPLKAYGWKPDFWVPTADAIITECLILDNAKNQPTDCVAAWSSLVSLAFSSIRDGYYLALRMQRMSTRKKSIRRQESLATATMQQPPTPTSVVVDAESSPSPTIKATAVAAADETNFLSPSLSTRGASARADSLNVYSRAQPIFE